MRLKVTYFPVEVKWAWALWQDDGSAFHIDIELHPSRDIAEAKGNAALSIFQPLRQEKLT